MRNSLCLVFFLCIFPLISCSGGGRNEIDDSSSVETVRSESQRADDLVSSMSLEEKCSQLFMIAVNGTTRLSESTASAVREFAPGAVLFFKYNISEDLRETFLLTGELQDIARESGRGIPLFIAIDHEGGVVFRFKEGLTRLPAASQVAKSGNIEAAGALYSVAAKELLALGFNMNLAPVLEPLSNDNRSFLGSRSFGRDAEVVSRFGTACVEAMQENGVCAVAKHFPANGNADPHDSVPSLNYTRSALDKEHIGPFKEAVKSGVSAMMISHVSFPRIDGDKPATLSKAIISDLLKDTLGFSGIVLTDDLRMKALTKNYKPEDSAVLALQAGADMLMYTGGDFKAVRDAVVKAVRDGILPESRLDDAVGRVVKTKMHYKLWDVASKEKRGELFVRLADIVSEGAEILKSF